MDLSGQPGAALRPFVPHRLAVGIACLLVLPHSPVLAVLLAGSQLPLALLLRRLAAIRVPRHRRGWWLLLPYLLWLACRAEIGLLLGLAGGPTHDAGIAAADLVIFGVHWHTRIREVVTGTTAAEAMQAVYLSYYLLILVPPLVLALRGRHDDCVRYTRFLLSTYLVCFLINIVLPVLGPRAVDAAAGPAAGPGGAMAGLAEFLRRCGDIEGTAFPSSHCAGSLAAALAAGEFLPRPGRAALLAWAGLIALSTLHTGNHYALDAAAGLLLAGGVRFILTRSRAARSTRTQEVLS
jgi:membrane-associated phospholipid phosphatase